MTTLANAISATQPPDGGMRVGIVETINPLTVNVTGGPIPAGIQGSYVPAVGDNVTLIREASTWLITGRVGAPSMAFPTGIEIVADGGVNTGVGGLNVYQDMAGATGQISKASDTSREQVIVTFSMYATPAQVALGMRTIWTPTSGATGLTLQVFPTLKLTPSTSRTPIARIKWLAGIPAGDYSVRFQWAVTVDPGGATLNRNADDFFSAVIEER